MQARIQLNENAVVHAEAGIHIRRLQGPADKDPGRHQECERERELRDDKEVAPGKGRPRAAPVSSPACSLRSVTTSGRDSFHAGPSPEISVLRTQNPSMAPSTRRSGLAR